MAKIKKTTYLTFPLDIQNNYSNNLLLVFNPANPVLKSGLLFEFEYLI